MICGTALLMDHLHVITGIYARTGKQLPSHGYRTIATRSQIGHAVSILRFEHMQA